MMNIDAHDQKIVLPRRILEPLEPGKDDPRFERINKMFHLNTVLFVRNQLGKKIFKKIRESFLSSIVKLAEHEEVVFSGKLVHYFLKRRILLDNEDLWFTFAEQPMRFSFREFVLTTGLPSHCEKLQVKSKGGKKREEDFWMKKATTLTDLQAILQCEAWKKEMSPDERLRLGALIIVESVLLAHNLKNKIPVERLSRAMDFEEFCSYPWGKICYDTLVKGVKRLKKEALLGTQYNPEGFLMAIQLWGLSSVDELGRRYGVKHPGATGFPLCLHWKSTETPNLIEISLTEKTPCNVKCIIGDPEIHRDLVKEVGCKNFEKVIALVLEGFKLQRKDWENGYILRGEASGDINDLREEISFLREKVKFLEDKLRITAPGITEQELSLPKSKYEEDVYVNNHTSPGIEAAEEASYDMPCPAEEKRSLTWGNEIAENLDFEDKKLVEALKMEDEGTSEEKNERKRKYNAQWNDQVRPEAYDKPMRAYFRRHKKNESEEARED